MTDAYKEYQRIYQKEYREKHGSKLSEKRKSYNRQYYLKNGYKPKKKIVIEEVKISKKEQIQNEIDILIQQVSTISPLSPKIEDIFRQTNEKSIKLLTA